MARNSGHNLNIYWGDTHDNVGQRPDCPVSMARNMALAASHLDFYAPALYTAAHIELEARDGSMHGGKPCALAVERWKNGATLAREWRELEAQTRAFHAPGSFVTFPGYEWQGDGRWGDHNVLFHEEGGSVDRVDALPELYAALRGRNAIAIPHHTAYKAECRGREWTMCDENLSPFAEIYSVHGGSETDEECCGLRINTKMGPSVSGGTYQDALDRGLHLGAIGSTDGTGVFPGRYHWGLMACLAPELTREALWEAFLERRVYAVTGDRIELDFHLNDAVMGSRVTASAVRRIRVAVVGSDALDRIEVLRNGRVIHTHCHQGTWRIPPPGRVSRFKLRIEAGWGPYVRESGDGSPRQWTGSMAVGPGARFLASEPCWVHGGQQRPVLDGEVADFAIVSPVLAPGASPLSRVQNAHVFELEATADTALTLAIDGLGYRGTVGELCAGSRVLWHDAECRRLLQARFGLDVDTFERPTFSYLLSHKVKLHRIIPEAGYTAAFEITDEEPLGGETNYRIRIEQRNGQKAWSSPIWVRSA